MSQAAKEFVKQLLGRRSKKDQNRLAKKFMFRCNQPIKDAEKHQKNKDLVAVVSNCGCLIFKGI